MKKSVIHGLRRRLTQIGVVDGPHQKPSYGKGNKACQTSSDVRSNRISALLNNNGLAQFGAILHPKTPSTGYRKWCMVAPMGQPSIKRIMGIPEMLSFYYTNYSILRSPSRYKGIWPNTSIQSLEASADSSSARLISSSVGMFTMIMYSTFCEDDSN